MRLSPNNGIPVAARENAWLAATVLCRFAVDDAHEEALEEASKGEGDGYYGALHCRRRPRRSSSRRRTAR